MARRVSGYIADDVRSAPTHVASAANLVAGYFAGIGSDGELRPADASSGVAVIARGALTEGAQIKDGRGNVQDTTLHIGYVDRGVIGGLSGIVPGAEYYLSSGGDITPNKFSASGTLNQRVGYGLTTTVISIDIAQAVQN